MKKLITALSLTTYLTFASSAFAAVTVKTCPPAPFNVLCNQTVSSTFIQNIITWLFILAVLLAVIYLIWGGIKWITSGGDKAGLEAARQHIIAAIIGLVVVFLTYFILNFIFTYFGLSNVSSGNQGLFTLPGT